MRAIKRMVAAVMLVTMVFCMVSTTALAASYDNIPVDSLTAINDAFEEKVRRAGRIIAEERGLLLPASAYEQHRNAYAGQNTLNADTQTFYEEVKNNSVTLDDIYQEFPALASEALSTTGLDSSYTEPLVAVRASSDPEFGDYRSNIYYTYYERVETDSVESDTYSGLANLAISIVSISLKPAQAIVVSVLQAAIGSNTWTSCSDYHLTTLEESCLSGKWGEVYTSGGLLCETDWRGYCYASRTDEYAIATAVTWKGNTCFSETTDAVRVHYAYDDKFYNATYLRTKSLELYQKAYDETYTVLYGVLPGYVEYNWYDDVTWTSPKSNPFA